MMTLLCKHCSLVVCMKKLRIFGYPKCAVKIQVRLRKFAGWSETALGAHFRRQVSCCCCSCAWHYIQRSFCTNNYLPICLSVILNFSKICVESRLLLRFFLIDKLKTYIIVSLDIGKMNGCTWNIFCSFFFILAKGNNCCRRKLLP